MNRKTSLACCHVEVETDDGLIGHGLTSITEEDVIAQIVNGVAGPAITGDDPLAHERVWDKLYWMLMPRGQTGYAAHALAAIDVALWDIKGKALGQPVWRLLGGAHPRVPVYATFGFGFFDREQLAAAAKLWVAQGFTRLKMTVGNEALRHRDARAVMDVIREDAARVRAVREAVGPDVELFIDGNCNLDLYHATRLAEMIKPLGISFFEEPLTQNDVPGMAQLQARRPAWRWPAGRTRGSRSASATCSPRRRSTTPSPTSPSPAASPSAPKSPAWLRPSTSRSPTAGRGASTTCTCRPAWRTARWSSTTIWRWNCASRSIAACRSPRTGAFVMSRHAGPRLRAGPRCDPRDREAPAVAGPQQGLKRRGPGMAASPGLSGFSLIIA